MRRLTLCWILLWGCLVVGQGYAGEEDEPDWAGPQDAFSQEEDVEGGFDEQTDAQTDAQIHEQADTAPPAIKPQHAEATAKVGLFVNPPEANIYVDGEYKGQGQFVGKLPAGAHTVRFEYQGFNTVQEQLDLEPEGGPAYLVIHMRPSRLTDVQMVGRTGGWVDTFDADIAGWSLTGGGAVLLAGGIVLLAMDGEASCGGGCGDVFETSAAGATLTALGASTLTAGITFFLWDQLAGRRPGEDTSSPSEEWRVGAAPISQDQQWSGGRVWVGATW